MNIALVITNTTPVPATRGGATENMMNLLIDVNEVEQKHHFIIFSTFEQDAFEESKKYKFTEFHYYHRKKYDNLMELPSRILRKLTFEHRDIRSNYTRFCADIINKRKIDMVIVEGYCFCIQQMRNLIGDKMLVLHMHIDRLNQEMRSSKRIIRSCDALIAISEFCKKRMLEVEPSYKSKIHVLKNTIDTQRFCAEGRLDSIRKVYEKIGLNPWDNVVYYCGRIVPDKGVLELVKAIKLLDDDDIHLMIIGSSVYRDGKKTPYMEEVSQSGRELKNGITFTGYIPQWELADYIAGGTLAVVPSKCLEAAGNVTIEALSCGVPVIASTQGGIPEYADPKACVLVKCDNSFVENLARAIHEVITDKKRLALMQSEARNVALQYDKVHYYTHFCEVVDKIIKDKRL